jgi:antitoxin component of MazEF toxin-antitoxin module
MNSEARVRIAEDGGLSLPDDILTAAGLTPGLEIEAVVEGRTIRLFPAALDGRKLTRGERAVLSVTGSATTDLTHAELMALLRDDDD